MVPRKKPSGSLQTLFQFPNQIRQLHVKDKAKNAILLKHNFTQKYTIRFTLYVTYNHHRALKSEVIEIEHYRAQNIKVNHKMHGNLTKLY